jgi:ATP-dependent RNA helicase DeaD
MENQITFQELSLSPKLLKAIDHMGFTKTFPIQSETIPFALNGDDLIGQAKTGTGKTIAFAIPVIEKINSTIAATQAIILCPTRELAIQVADEIKNLLKYNSDIRVVAVYGGQPIDRQIRSLKKKIHIVVGTPGRVLDHIERRTLKLNGTSIAVLDEADEMLSMGFRDDIESILKNTPHKRQLLLFSATMSSEVLRLTKRLQKNPKFIKSKDIQSGKKSSIEQYYFDVDFGKRFDVLDHLLEKYNPRQAIVFCNTKRRVKALTSRLKVKGYKVDELHGDIRQSRRTSIMASFKSGKLSLLIATDVAARGIDIENIDAVINYELPDDIESYVHRIGRTGRAGKTGRAFSFVMYRDRRKIMIIQKVTGMKIIPGKIPTKQQLEEKKVHKFLVDIKNLIQKKDLLGCREAVEKHLSSEQYSSLDLAAAMLHMGIKGERRASPHRSDF